MQVNNLSTFYYVGLINRISVYHLFNYNLKKNISTTTKSKTCSHSLKRIFNDTFYWNRYVQNISKNNKFKYVGLCGFTNLNSPKEFIQNANLCVKYSNVLVNTICNDYISHRNDKANSGQAVSHLNPEAMIVKRLDRLSDKLCSMVDTFELLRNVHPNPEYIEAANEAYEILNNYFNQLNTNYHLYKSLKHALDTDTISSQLSAEEKVVANILLEDFENSGIHMPPEKRQKFIDLQDNIARLGHKFTLNAYTEFRPIEVENPREILKGLPYRLQNQIIYKIRDKLSFQENLNNNSENEEEEEDEEEGEQHFPLKEVGVISDPFIAQQILQTVENEEIRRKVYLELNSSTVEQIKTLEDMLYLRGELANLIGYSSYAEMNIKDKMAKNPDNVLNFLNNMSKIYKPNALKEVKELLKLKKNSGNKLSTLFKKIEFYPWDYQYYTNVLKNSSFNKEELSNKKRLYNSLLSYFSVGSIIEGLSNLYTHLYGISFQPSSSISQSELWHEDVRKLDVIHETEGTIGMIYCDFFSRPNPTYERKYENAAHFTIQCARRVDYDQLDTAMNESLHVIEGLKSTSTTEQIQQGTVMMKQVSQPVKYFEGKGTYQLPIVVIVTNFERPLSQYHTFQQSSRKNDHENSHSVTKPSFLTWSEMETLFHEMGHAIHSILARTNFQNVSGTRCKMDFVEVPSILMEYFLQSDEVISSVAHHYQTDEPLKPKYINFMKNNITQNYNSNKSINIQTQLKLSILDQIYHSSLFNKHLNKSNEKIFNPLIDKPGISTTILEQVTNEFDIYPYIQDTQWQGQFTHLYSYGSTYYTYFWCRKIAEEIWNKLFNSNIKQKNGKSKSLWDSLNENKSCSFTDNDNDTFQESEPFNSSIPKETSKPTEPLRLLGEKLKGELLQWGGARDPWIGLKNLGIFDSDLENETFFMNFFNGTKSQK